MDQKQIEEVLSYLKSAGYKITKPQRKTQGKTVNPLGHAFPHARLYNHTLTPISRLRKVSPGFSQRLIANDDPRNYTISGKPPT